MKKILIFILAIASALTMFACKKEDDGLKAFKTAVAATDPAVIEVDTKMMTAAGELASKATTTYNEDGSFTLVYWYEQFNTSANGASDELKTKIEKTVTCDKDGKYSDGGDLAGTSTATTGHKLNLGAKKLSYKISADKNVLTATVKAADTEAVLGVSIAADVTLVVAKNADAVVSLTLNYTLETGAVEVVCNYK